MRFSATLMTACTVSSVHALSFPSLDLPSITLPSLFRRQSSSCPAVWTQISSELSTAFIANGQCNNLARAALRFAFHDQGTFTNTAAFTAPASGGADGSLLLNDEEMTRIENNNDPIRSVRSFLLDLMAKHSVGAADLVAFAANAAIKSCPGGPTVRTVVGRKDSSAAAAPRLLPPGFGPGSDHDSILQLFRDKGFSPSELAALMGAHSVARAFDQAQLPRGVELDSTPGQFDVKYYDEMLSAQPPQGVGRLDSDRNLAKDGTTVGNQFKRFVGDQSRFEERFADAMFKLSVLGVPQNEVARFVDCTAVLPVGSAKRDVRARAINARARGGSD
ncbi:fungal class II heme-containing peroxidase [Botryosphaeria dothidea]